MSMSAWPTLAPSQGALVFGALNRAFYGYGQDVGRTTCLHLHGEFDDTSSSLLEGWLVTQQDRHPEMVVDLGRVTFMDASTLRAFLRAADRAHRSGRQFTLVGASPMVMKMLAIIGATALVDTAPPAPSEGDSGRVGTLPGARGGAPHA